MAADFDPSSLNKLEREKRARMYKTVPKEDKTNSTVVLHRLLEEIIDQREEDGLPKLPEFEETPPILKGYKTLPKYSKFLTRVCALNKCLKADF